MKYRKIVFPREGAIEVQDAEMDTGQVGANEVIVRTHYSFVSAGTELACLKGQEPEWFRFPETPGYIAVGEVSAIGADVGDFQVGDHIYVSGGHSEYLRRDLVTGWGANRRLAADVDLKHAAFAGMAAISLQGLRASRIELGDYVGVIGLGVIGNVAAQLAQLQGGRVIGMDTQPFRVERARQCGIDRVLEVGRESNRSRIETITRGEMLHSLIDATGNSAAIMANLDTVGSGGEVILLGTPRDEHQANVTELLEYVHYAKKGALSFKGTCGLLPPRHDGDRDFALAVQLLGEGRLKVDPLLTHLAKPDEAESVYRGLAEKPGEYLGAMFDWRTGQ